MNLENNTYNDIINKINEENYELDKYESSSESDSFDADYFLLKLKAKKIISDININNIENNSKTKLEETKIQDNKKEEKNKIINKKNLENKNVNEKKDYKNKININSKNKKLNKLKLIYHNNFDNLSKDYEQKAQNKNIIEKTFKNICTTLSPKIKINKENNEKLKKLSIDENNVSLDYSQELNKWDKNEKDDNLNEEIDFDISKSNIFENNQNNINIMNQIKEIENEYF